jgi:4-aminobutyrate aminotransferase-like enzyme
MEDHRRQLNNRSLTEEYNRVTGHGTLYPMIFDTATKCEITDIEGNKYIDFSSGYGVINAGWQRKELIKVMQTQAEKSCFSIPWMGNLEATRLAEKLIMLTPEKLQKCIRATGGGDANELGIKAVYSRHGGDILSFYYSYHGGTSVTLSLGDSERFHFPGNPARLSKFKVCPPYCYRCPLNQCYGECSFSCAESVDIILKKNPEIKMMILEPVIGSGGIIIPPGKYWKILREICSRHDIKLIIDEVMTGFGRTGSLFAVDQMEIVPDVLTLSKGMSSGYVPIGAAIMTSELSDHLCRNFNDVTSTYAWTPLACAVALANINLIIQEKLDSNAQIMGKYLINRLEEVFNRYLPNETGDIRGKGLMVGVEIVKDRKTKEPAYFLGKKIVLACQKNGLIIGASWNWNVLVFLPPLIITQPEADKGLNILEDTLRRYIIR